MKTYAYSVTVEGQGNQHIINTNDVSYAIHEFLRAHACGCEVVVCNGTTGEVLCNNGDEPWCTDEMALMILGYMCAESWGEEDEDDEPAKVVEIDPTAVPSDDVLDNLRQLARSGNFLAQALLS